MTSRDIVGFCGLGRMGAPIAKNLASAGFDVRAWNRSKGKAPEGVREVETPREAAQAARFVVTMLADDAAVQAVVLGENGLLAAMREGAVHVGMSTVSTQLSQRLYEAHKAANQHFVAAPVFGRPEAAQARKLFIVPGGDDTAVAMCQPLFAAAGQGTFPAGSAPQASLAKLCGNFMLASLIEMFGEVFALADKAGMDPAKLAQTLTTILFAGAPIPSGYASRIAATQFEPAGFAMPLGHKDVSLALRAAEALAVPMPLATLLKDHLLESLAKGREGWDWAGFSAVLRESAGLPAKR
ncbi:MAG TPA: NAD(P)-dependent oxidoreductase [Myxococcales bacterium]|nr:NAD(P)-dependent oxidoreductase [Myxococcales bacterium]